MMTLRRLWLLIRTGKDHDRLEAEDALERCLTELKQIDRKVKAEMRRAQRN